MGPDGNLEGASGQGPTRAGSRGRKPHAESRQLVPTPCRTSGLGYREVACPSLPCWGSFLPTLTPKPVRGPGICSRTYLTLLHWDPPYTTRWWKTPVSHPRPLLKKTPPPTPATGAGGTFTRVSFSVYYLKSRCFVFFSNFVFIQETHTRCQDTSRPDPTPRAGNAFLGRPWRGQRSGRGRFLPGASILRPAEAQTLFKNR